MSVNIYCYAHNDVNSHPTVRLVTGEGYYPYVDKDIIHGGWSRALVTQTFALMNVQIEVDILPWSRGLKWTKETHFLGTFPYVYSESRAKDFLFSVAINQLPVHLYVTRESGVKSIEQLKEKRLCIPHGYSIDSIPQSIPSRLSFTINQAKDGVGCLRQVQKGWSDVGVTNGYIDSQELKTAFAEDQPIYILPEQLASVPLYLMISKRYPDAQQWIDRFNHAFAELNRNGGKEQIDLQFTTLLLGQ